MTRETDLRRDSGEGTNTKGERGPISRVVGAKPRHSRTSVMVPYDRSRTTFTIRFESNGKETGYFVFVLVDVLKVPGHILISRPGEQVLIPKTLLSNNIRYKCDD